MSIAILFALVATFFLGKKPVEISQPLMPTASAPVPLAPERPHFSPKIRAGEELKADAQVQNSLEVLTALLDQGRDAELLQRLQLEIENHPQTVEYRAFLADYYYLKENWEGAEAALKEVLRLDPTNAYVLSTLGEVVGIQGRYDEGLSYMSEVLDRNPSHLEALYGSLSLSELKGTPEWGIEKVSALYRAHPENGNNAVAYADVLVAQGRRSERAKVLEAAMQTDPKNPAPYRMAAMDALNAKRFNEAISLAEKALSLESDLDTKSQSIEMIFDAAVARRDFRKAIGAIEMGESLQPWNQAWAIRRQQIEDLR